MATDLLLSSTASADTSTLQSTGSSQQAGNSAMQTELRGLALSRPAVLGPAAGLPVEHSLAGQHFGPCTALTAGGCKSRVYWPDWGTTLECSARQDGLQSSCPPPVWRPSSVRQLFQPVSKTVPSVLSQLPLPSLGKDSVSALSALPPTSQTCVIQHQVIGRSFEEGAAEGPGRAQQDLEYLQGMFSTMEFVAVEVMPGLWSSPAAWS